VASLTSSSFTARASLHAGRPAGNVLQFHLIEVFKPFMLGVYTPQLIYTPQGSCAPPRLPWVYRPTLCAHRLGCFAPFREILPPSRPLDTPFLQNPRTNGTFADLRYMLYSPEPFRTGREGDPTLASQHVPQVY
jgi:hypothetical protein